MKTPISQPNFSDFATFKADLRAQARARRDALSCIQKREFSRCIVAHAHNLVRQFQPRIIAIYLSNGREVDLGQLVALSDATCIIVAPREVDGSHPAPFWTLQSTLMADSTRRAPDETVGRAWAPHEIDVFLVPGLAFDERGNRLGQGGGWYDKVLCRAPQAITIGVAFETQIVAQLPTEAHDKPVDYVVTEERIISCRRD